MLLYYKEALFMELEMKPKQVQQKWAFSRTSMANLSIYTYINLRL